MKSTFLVTVARGLPFDDPDRSSYHDRNTFFWRDSDMFTIIVDIVVKREFVTRFREAVIRQGDSSRLLEPDCLGFDILQDPSDPTRFTLYETYSDAATFHEVHRVTSHFLAYAEVTEPWVESKSIRAMTRIWP